MRYRWARVVLLFVGYALSGVVQIRPGERGVVRRFGRLLSEPLTPGLSILLPWGMDRVDKVAVDRVQSVVVGYQEDDSSGETMPAGQLLTGDQSCQRTSGAHLQGSPPRGVGVRAASRSCGRFADARGGSRHGALGRQPQRR